MAAVWTALDAREQAFLIWSVLLLGAILLRRDFRGAIGELVILLVRPPLLLAIVGAVAYVGGLVALAAAAGLWTVPLLGVSALWFFGPGVVMLFTSNDAITDPDYFRKALGWCVWGLFIIEAVANLAVFPLGVELVVLPVLLGVVLLEAFAASNPKYDQVRTMMQVVLALFFLAYVGRTAYALATEFESYATLETLMRLLLPPALTLAFLGYVYLLRLYMRREHRRLHPVARHGIGVESTGGDYPFTRSGRERRNAA